MHDLKRCCCQSKYNKTRISWLCASVCAYILQPFHSHLATRGRMGPLMDINLLRWHIFKGGGGDWEEKTTAHNCPFLPELAPALLTPVAWLMHTPQPVSNSSLCPAPGENASHGRQHNLIFSQLCTWMAGINIQQTKSFSSLTLSTLTT